MSDTKEEYWDFIWNQPDLPEKIKFAFSVKKFDKQKILDILKRENKKTICDAGCGFGMYALYFAKYGFRVSGFDVSQKAVTAAQKILQENKFLFDSFVVSSITDIQFEDHRFDAVFSNSVLDHMMLCDAQKGIAELERITKEDGIIYLSFDILDEEDERLPHEILPDGSYQYTQGNRSGMILYPHTEESVREFVKGHEAHAGLIEKEANGEKVVPNILLMHAEDQLMSAETIKMMALEIIKLNQRLYSLEK